MTFDSFVEPTTYTFNVSAEIEASETINTLIVSIESALAEEFERPAADMTVDELTYFTARSYSDDITDEFRIELSVGSLQTREGFEELEQRVEEALTQETDILLESPDANCVDTTP